MAKISIQIFALAACVLVANPAAAAGFHVHVGGTRTSGPSTTGDWQLANCYGTIAAALVAAAPADSILLYEESHVLDTAATLSSLLTNRHLVAAPGDAEVVIGAAGTLAVDPALATTEISGVQFVGAMGPRLAAALTIANPTGAIDHVTIRGCTFREMYGGTVSGAGGSALRATSPGNGAVLEIADCDFSGNQTQGNGGALWLGGGYTVSVVASTFTANRARGNSLGGAVMVDAASAHSLLTIEDSQFFDNTSAGPGGALNVDSASLVMRRCVVQGSRSAWLDGTWWKEGAGLRVSRAGGHTEPVNVLVEYCEFVDNRGNNDVSVDAGDGGGILVKGGDVTRMTWAEIAHCLFRDNSNTQGAGVYLGRFCQGEVSYCRFLDNVAWYQGGGAFKGGELPQCAGELATFAYCEFRGNLAGFRPDGTDTGEYCRGGGLMVRNYPRAWVYNCTFVDNRVNDASYAIGDGFAHAIEGGEWTPANRCRLVNSVFWGAGGDVQVRSEGVGGMELVSNVAAASGQVLVAGTTPAGSVTLTGFPFASPLDLHPGLGSPLIDAGIAVPYVIDLAGIAVPHGAGYDIGCYEFVDPVGIGDVPPGRGLGLSVSPNPFNPRTTLSFNLDDPGAVILTIHDARGRLVRELWAGEAPAGGHALVWDGRDDGNRAVAAGVYVSRLRVDGRESGQAKLCLVR